MEYIVCLHYLQYQMQTSRVAILLLFFSLPLFHRSWLKPTDNISSPHFFFFFINSWWILFSGWHQNPVMVQNSPSVWLACCLLAEKKKKKKCLYKDFWKVTNCDVVGWGRTFGLFLQDLNFKVFMLSDVLLLLEEQNANCSGLSFLSVLLFYL